MTITLVADPSACSRAEFDAQQHANFERLLAAVMTKSHGTHPRAGALAGVTTVDDLARVAPTDPAELARACPPQADWLVGDNPCGLILASSGTAARAKTVYHSWAFTDQVNRLGARGITGLAGTPVAMVNCMTPGGANGAYSFVTDVTRLLGSAAIGLGSAAADNDVWRWIHGHRVDMVVAGPLRLVDLARSAPRRQESRPRWLCYLGEGLSNSDRQRICERLPDARVSSFAYSTSETGPLGAACSHLGDGEHHPHLDAVVVEVVDPDTGKAVGSGEIGEVLATPLLESGTALVRYRVGDLATYDANRRCACGNPAGVLTLKGRTATSTLVDTHVISAAALASALAPFGVTEPSQVQMAIIWDGTTYRIELTLDAATTSAPPARDDTVARVLCADIALGRVIGDWRCGGLSAAQRPRSAFIRNDRGKVPTFVHIRAQGGIAATTQPRR